MGDRFRHIWETAGANFPEALTTLVVGLIVVELLLALINVGLRLSGMKAGLRKITKSLLRVFLFVVLFVAVIQALGLNNVFVALGGSSVIVALMLSTGLAPLITDVLAGLFLGSDREFQPGATVCAGDKGTVGEVQAITLRKTYLKEKKKGTLHVIPNSIIEKNEWVILKKSPETLKRARARGKVK